MTSPVWGRHCDGGHFCSAPKECCPLGCCYRHNNGQQPQQPMDRMYNVLFVGSGHWYIWAMLSLCILCALAACSIWRRCRCPHQCGSGLRSNIRMRHNGAQTDDSRSDINSSNDASSCCAPPHYSRCGSFHNRTAPPPYNEVTSKPDLYPLVISYNGACGEGGLKRGGSYLMVQYFRNYILRPTGSISATSTVDSLSSSFICNAVNEANTIIPPPYSCTGSLETFHQNNEMLRSLSSVNCNGTSVNQSQRSIDVTCTSPERSLANQNSETLTFEREYRGKPAFKATSFVNNNLVGSEDSRTVIGCSGANECSGSKLEGGKRSLYKRIVQESSLDSETSQGDENNFSELLNLSVCASSALNERQQLYTNCNIANSVTASDISSLANLGTPDSPPRATSPTLEIRQLLDKIQNLPKQKSPELSSPPLVNSTPTSKFFIRSKSKTLYMPLSSSISKTPSFFQKNFFSRSAPTTPCSNLAPKFPKSQKNKMADSTALLESGYDQCENDDECQ